jgi:IS5 family transposase
MSDHKGAVLMLPSLPPAKALLGDKGYDSNQLRQALIDRGIEPCIPSKRNRKQPFPMTGRSTASGTASRTCSAD